MSSGSIFRNIYSDGLVDLISEFDMALSRVAVSRKRSEDTSWTKTDQVLAGGKSGCDEGTGVMYFKESQFSTGRTFIFSELFSRYSSW